MHGFQGEVSKTTTNRTRILKLASPITSYNHFILVHCLFTSTTLELESSGLLV